MLTYFKRLMFDEGVFTTTVRSGLAAVGLGIESGRLPFPVGYEWIGIVAVGAALFMRSSVKPQPKPIK